MLTAAKVWPCSATHEDEMPNSYCIKPVRGGAHSFPGYSVGDGALVIDLSRMNRVSVDAETRRAAAQAHGLVTPAGMISHTGVGGHPWWRNGLALPPRRLSIASLVSAEIVVADGRILQVDDQRRPDPFWARG
jgi:FAD binding domain